MTYSVHYYGSASEAATDQESRDESTVSEFKTAAIADHGDELARILTVASILINGQHAVSDNQVIPVDATVDVLPPFAGG